VFLILYYIIIQGQSNNRKVKHTLMLKHKNINIFSQSQDKGHI
jgi:hypothetical protein